MRTLKKLLLGAGLAGSLIFGATNKSFAQDASQTSKEKLFPNLNFYFETGEYANYVGHPAFKKHVLAWLTNEPKENNKGNIWFYYGDTNEDGVYDYINVQKIGSPINSQEKFSFNFDTKKIDYVLEIYDYCRESINNCDKIISKSYNGIDQKEAKQIGEDFLERIKEFSSVQKEFSRFNSRQLEELVRKEYSYRLKMADGRLTGNSRIPIEKFLSEEEIKKVENYIGEKPERERLKREQEEKNKIEYEKQEKIRIEKETRKPKAKLKIGGGILGSGHSPTKLYFEINPQLTNKKGKGFAMGLDFFVMNSKINFERREQNGYDEEYLSPYRSLISERSSKYNISVTSTNRFGLDINYVSPAFEIFTNIGFLIQKMLIETTAVTEEYIKDHGSKQEPSSFKTKKINSWEGKKFFGPLYMGLGGELFPFFKKNNSSKNVSFSLELIVAGESKINSPYFPIYYKGGFIINTGLKYTFGK